MPATFIPGEEVKFIKEWKYGQRGELVCKIGLTGTIARSASSITQGANQTAAVLRDDNGQTVRMIPVAYLEHV